MEPILRLPHAERLEIAEEIVASLAEEKAAGPLTAEEAKLADAALAEHLAAPDSAIAWDEFRRETTK